jgi:hypothetical protein
MGRCIEGGKKWEDVLNEEKCEDVMREGKGKMC